MVCFKGSELFSFSFSKASPIPNSITAACVRSLLNMCLLNQKKIVHSSVWMTVANSPGIKTKGSLGPTLSTSANSYGDLIRNDEVVG